MKMLELDGVGFSRIDGLLTELSIRSWQQSEADFGQDSSWDELLEKMGSLFSWLAGNPLRPTSCSANAMAVRLWCFLYAVRPDLINDETAYVAAERFGVSNQRIFQILDDLKAKTGICYESRLGRLSPESSRRSIDGILRDRAARKLARLASRRYAT
jgi:hypothetical protein